MRFIRLKTLHWPIPIKHINLHLIFHHTTPSYDDPEVGCWLYLGFNSTLTAKVVSWRSVTHTFPGFLTPVLVQFLFPKPTTTFLICFCRGERRKDDHEEGFGKLRERRICSQTALFPFLVFYSSEHKINPFPSKPWFLCICSIHLLKTLWEKEKLLVTSNFSFSLSILHPFGKLSAIFINSNMSSANSFSLEELKICRLGKG